jgi:hypothetical protein
MLDGTAEGDTGAKTALIGLIGVKTKRRGGVECAVLYEQKGTP